MISAVRYSAEVVVTGVGVVSPIGIGRGPFWNALLESRSGIGRISLFDPSGLPVQLAGEVRDFDPKQYVRPRKSLKVMARDTQFGVTAAELACQDAGIGPSTVDADRFGVVFGADMIATELSESAACFRSCMVDGKFQFDRWGSHGMFEAFPLLFLKLLPNMIASHIAIAQDARGPNNTLHQGEVSSLMAISEALRVIERGWADVMIAGGASSRMQPFDWVRACLTDHLSSFDGDPSLAVRPFDAQRSGQVRGEGAAAFVLESRRHAEARGAKILARIAGSASSMEPGQHKKPSLAESARIPSESGKDGIQANSAAGLCGCGLARAVQNALRDANLEAFEIGHVNAHGLSTQEDDRAEARALAQIFDAVPVTAPKSFFGNLGAAAGAVETAVSLLALQHGLIPATLNYSHPDPGCPVQVVRDGPQLCSTPAAVVVNQTALGQSAALVLTGP